ncbi:MAG: ATP-dependent DNA helicase RecQ [Micromonosporaceae bacterium]|nr:ATP-dependent DNA helicase RecQ [Micromonosporaceae bacterium]
MAALRAVLDGRDVLGVLPTGYGKSAIYQLPALLLDRTTLVISPLLALQRDQIEALTRAGTAAAQLTGEQSAGQRDEVLAAARRGEVRLLYVTPEQLADPSRLAGVRPGLVAVDEAHCVSAWGYDFRPDYLHLGAAIQALGRPATVALTATASPPVQDDITERLRLRDPLVLVSGVDRPNLQLAAFHCPDEPTRTQRLLSLVEQVSGAGIVYAPTRRRAEHTAQALSSAGHPARAYHAGLSRAARGEIHQEFIDDRAPIVVATTAFGMGIDKPDIRWVFHTALPESPDAYVQEIGRAGRDGEPAATVLLWQEPDASLRRYFASGSLAAEQVRAVIDAVRPGGSTRREVAERSGVKARRLGTILALLEQVGAVRTNGRRISLRGGDPAAAVAEVVRQAGRQEVIRQSRVDMIRQYAQTGACRGEFLAAYFGQRLPGPCGHCDNCAAGRSATPPTEWADYPTHSVVHHREWGRGIVMGHEPDRLTVLFDEVGYRTLALAAVREHDLLVR